jgi:DNA-binding MarR family transcriptional regulator
MTDIAEKALTVIQSKPEGVLQSELWKQLEIDSRKCSRIIKALLDEGKLERVEYRKDGQRTYLLKAKKSAVNPALLIAGGELLPCVCCEEECEVLACPLLLDWMYQLAIEEYETK